MNDLYHQMFMSFFTVRLRLQPEVVVYVRFMFIGREKDANDSENTPQHTRQAADKRLSDSGISDL